MCMCVVCVYVSAYTYLGVQVEVRDQLAGISFLLLSCGSWNEQRSQLWWQAPLSTEPSWLPPHLSLSSLGFYQLSFFLSSLPFSIPPLQRSDFSTLTCHFTYLISLALFFSWKRLLFYAVIFHFNIIALIYFESPEKPSHLPVSRLSQLWTQKPPVLQSECLPQLSVFESMIINLWFLP